MVQDEKKPSPEASQDLVILGITLATADDLADSIEESYKKTAVYTLSERLHNIAAMSPIPKLKTMNWRHWHESVQTLLSLSQTSAVFQKNPPSNRAIKLWSIWWSSKLRETAPHIQSAPSDNARDILKEIIIDSQAQIVTSVLNVTARFWNYKPGNNITSYSYIKEFQKRLHELREHTNISSDVKIQAKNLLLYHINTKWPDLMSRCKNLSLEQTLSECLSGTSADRPSNKNKNKSVIKCNFCNNLGHSIDECRKKQKSEKNKNKNSSGSKILSVNKPTETSCYQLDTAADFHVCGNEDDFSSYFKSSQLIGVAGGGQVTTDGHGDMFLPTSDSKLEILNGAIHLSGENTHILSTSQLEKQGFSIYWPSNYQDIELLRPDGTTCAYFRREAGKLLWKPKHVETVKPSMQRSQNWL
ncbi:putative serine threonine protein kinase domain protein [Erysiphe necator]|uniref:Putative serine threonine protein kinase domain protein n=1 Tax=Uncinula necator TaxID=52586 RepID=A0A0B1P8K1_UNCNE|nr:putative serine threonine protein kinase domain protein [Erysiphe necator]